MPRTKTGLFTVSPALVSKVTDAVMEQVVEWQSPPLDADYPIVYLDCIVLKVRQGRRVINTSVFLTLGINIEEKVVWLAIQIASQKWTMPLRDWRMAMSRFIIEFGNRLDGHF